MGEPLSDKKPRRWDELLSKARSRTPDVVARLPVEACMVFTELAAALEEERDHRDSAVEYSEHQHDELVMHRQQIERLNDKLREVEIEVSGPLLDRLHRTIVGAIPHMSEVRTLTRAALARSIVAALEPILSAEVTAKVSEAQVAVPPPEAVGQIIKTEFAWPDSVQPREQVAIALPFAHQAQLRHRVGEFVGIWPASLAEQVADRELDNEGLERELEDADAVTAERDALLAYLRGDVTAEAVAPIFDAAGIAVPVGGLRALRRELDAMTAVARLLLDGWELDDNELSIAASAESRGMTDAERRALRVLSEGESDGG